MHGYKNTYRGIGCPIFVSSNRGLKDSSSTLDVTLEELVLSGLLISILLLSSLGQYIAWGCKEVELWILICFVKHI